MGKEDKLGMVAQGAGIAGQAYGIAKEVFGINQKRDDKRQLKQQGKLSQQQADIQYATQMKMWKDTNYDAQVAELEKAGLNPALIYGQGGGGGTTAGGGVSGGQAANSAATSQAGTAAMGMGLQAGMMAAQLELIKAQTEKTKAEAEKTAGVDTTLGEAQTAESQARAEIAKLDAKLKGESMENQLTIIEYTSEKLLGERDKAWAEGNVAQATQVQEIKLINQQLTNKALEAIAIQTGTRVDEARINEISNDIQRKWQELNLQGAKTRYEHEDRLTAIKEYTKTSLQTAGIIAAGNVVGDVVRIATRRPPSTGSKSITENSKGEWSETNTTWK